MNVAAVMAEMGLAYGTLPDVRVYVGAPARIVAPGGDGAVAVVPFPTEVGYDATYGRGMDTLVIEPMMVLGRPTDRGTVDRLSAYASGGGPGSVKAVLESYAWTTCHGVRVTGADLDAVQVAGAEYMSIIFRTEVWGPGGN